MMVVQFMTVPTYSPARSGRSDNISGGREDPDIQTTAWHLVPEMKASSEALDCPPNQTTDSAAPSFETSSTTVHLATSNNAHSTASRIFRPRGSRPALIRSNSLPTEPSANGPARYLLAWWACSLK